MGCDIHAYLETKSGETWWLFAELHINRDYELFGLMAGVRGGNALVPQRGIPDNLSFSVVEANTIYVSQHIEDCGAGYTTPANADSWIRSGISTWVDEHHRRLTHPDWHSHSWLTADEVGKVASHVDNSDIRMVHAAMKACSTESRLVFWFDN